MNITQAEEKDLPVLVKLALGLWPAHEAAELEGELADTLGKADAAFFIAWESSIPAGFAQCQLRHDYVEGTGTSPVGYMEGIYVDEGFRYRGIARGLLAACEAWAREQGCREFASDCELGNTGSLEFHLRMGFEEANRIICFTKEL